jgi:hypothetical protein
VSRWSVRIVPVTDEDDQGQAVAELVGTGRGLGRVGAGHLVQQPVRGRAKALLVLLTVEALRSVLRIPLELKILLFDPSAEATI